jgi:CrcB protein
MTTWLTQPVVLLTVGGALGTNARYGLGYFVRWLWPSLSFPLGTFLINVSGSALLAFLAFWCRDRAHNPTQHHIFLLLGAGFCGGYTTFSTFAVETIDLMRRHHPLWGIANVVASVLVSLVLTAWIISANESR